MTTYGEEIINDGIEIKAYMEKPLVDFSDFSINCIVTTSTGKKAST